jgi:hypothetical protein
MSSWEIIKGLNFRQLKSLIFLLFRHPIFMTSTVRATFSVMTVAQREFPSIHGAHNKANAFRHALWNVFIAIECSKFSKDIDAVLKWTKDFTDWHEEFSPNEELPKAMDLHNNLIGRELYKEIVGRDKNQWIVSIKEELVNSVQITSVDNLEKYPNQLVYIEN